VRALLAEDNEVNIIVAEALLAKAGVRAEIAKNGREAVEMASGSPYEVIFMDCQMPELDGYEATQRIREAEHGHHTPIIAMTAHSMTGDRERCLAVGMDDYLTKPLRTDELERVLSRWLPADGSQKDLELSTNATGGVNAADSEDAEHDGEDPADELDEDAISELRDTLAAEMLETLLSTFEDSVSERLTEMTGALAGGDRSELRRLAHLLKGSSATLGASRMSAVCSELEQRCGDPEAEVSHAQLDELGASFQSACPALRSRLLS
jgi:CheY-like chemotaxis protein/HPt (histidine-containing phosphotransfer) domain-containing protein